MGKPIFFVAPNGSNANGDGTFDNPWRTIGKGVANLNGWDTLYIREGTYVEQVVINRSGTAAAPITIAAYPGEEVIIDGRAGVDSPNSGLPSNGDLYGTDSRDGTGYRYIPLVSIEANYIIFEGIHIKRSMGRGLRVWRSGRQTKGVTIRNCKISHSRASGLLLEKDCNEVTIEGCDISRSGNYAPYARPSAELDWSGGLAVKESRNITIKRSLVHENWGEGFIADTQTNGTKNVTVEGCVFYDNMRPSIYLHAVQSVRLEGNLIYHSNNQEFPTSAGIGVSAAEQQYDVNVPVEDVTIVNNIVVGCAHNIGFYLSLPDRYIQRLSLFFNTFVDGQDMAILEGNAKYRDCEFRNNLIYQSNGTPIISGGSGFDNWFSSHNAWSETPPSNVRSDDDMIGDPQLESPEAPRPRGQVDPAWFKIKSGSPVIGQASTDIPVGQDYFGFTRDAQPDMGAHEFQGAVSAASSPNASTDDVKGEPLFSEWTVAASLTAGGFKRFSILSKGAASGTDKVLAFGIQFPDRQCLVYTANQENGPEIFVDVGQALEVYRKQNALLRWMD